MLPALRASELSDTSVSLYLLQSWPHGEFSQNGLLHIPHLTLRRQVDDAKVHVNEAERMNKGTIRCSQAQGCRIIKLII